MAFGSDKDWRITSLYVDMQNRYLLHVYTNLIIFRSCVFVHILCDLELS